MKKDIIMALRTFSKEKTAFHRDTAMPIRTSIKEMDISFNSVIVTQDFLRIEDGKKDIFETPFKKNSKWMYHIAGSQIVASLDNISHKFFYGDDDGQHSLRWNIYSKCDLPFCTNSWAKIFSPSEEYKEYIAEDIVSAFKGSLVISFELPESVLEIFTENNIPYIDFSNYPIRFLPDYFYGVRTNVTEWYERIQKCALDYHIVNEFARITQAKASRIALFDSVEQCSVLFLGQMPIDSSLICDGEIANEDFVKEKLLESSLKYPNLYYKPHPHNKQAGSIIEYCSSLKVKIADFNIYDCFGCGKFVKIIGLSSGGIFEAKFFGLESERFLKKKYFFEDKDNMSLFYNPVYADFMRKDFWDYILHNKGDFIKTTPNPYIDAMKFSLQMKWGR